MYYVCLSLVRLCLSLCYAIAYTCYLCHVIKETKQSERKWVKVDERIQNSTEAEVDETRTALPNKLLPNI
jgi:hypothetical protein